MVAVVVGFAIALTWSYLALWLGPRVGLIDHPGDGLKVHKRPTPLLGGVGVFAGLHLGMAASGAGDAALFAGTSLVLLLGLADDRLELPPRLRLLAEVVAAVVLVALMDDGLHSPAGVVFAVAVIVVGINAVNLLDGLDALVGSTALVTAGGAVWAGVAIRGGWELGAALAGSLAGFLVLNRPPARLFLGDNGSYTVGMTLAYAALRATPEGTAPMLLLVAGLLGVYIIDLTVTILRRARNQKPLFTGDRSHIYDQLRERGWSTVQVVAIAALTQAVLVAGFVALAVAGPGTVPVATALVGVGCLALATAWRAGFLSPID